MKMSVPIKCMQCVHPIMLIAQFGVQAITRQTVVEIADAANQVSVEPWHLCTSAPILSVK